MNSAIHIANRYVADISALRDGRVKIQMGILKVKLTVPFAGNKTILSFKWLFFQDAFDEKETQQRSCVNVLAGITGKEAIPSSVEAQFVQDTARKVDKYCMQS